MIVTITCIDDNVEYSENLTTQEYQLHDLSVEFCPLLAGYASFHQSDRMEISGDASTCRGAVELMKYLQGKEFTMDSEIVEFFEYAGYPNDNEQSCGEFMLSLQTRLEDFMLERGIVTYGLLEYSQELDDQVLKGRLERMRRVDQPEFKSYPSLLSDYFNLAELKEFFESGDIVIAGGSCLSLILGHKYCDIDIFLTCNEARARQVINTLLREYDVIEANDYAITFYVHYTRVQVIRRLFNVSSHYPVIDTLSERHIPSGERSEIYVKNPGKELDHITVLKSFDIECCQVLFSYDRLYLTRQAIKSIRDRSIKFNPDLFSDRYCRRLTKYVSRGFKLQCPGMDEITFNCKAVVEAFISFKMDLPRNLQVPQMRIRPDEMTASFLWYTRNELSYQQHRSTSMMSKPISTAARYMYIAPFRSIVVSRMEKILGRQLGEVERTDDFNDKLVLLGTNTRQRYGGITDSQLLSSSDQGFCVALCQFMARFSRVDSDLFSNAYESLITLGKYGIAPRVPDDMSYGREATTMNDPNLVAHLNTTRTCNSIDFQELQPGRIEKITQTPLTFHGYYYDCSRLVQQDHISGEEDDSRVSDNVRVLLRLTSNRVVFCSDVYNYPNVSIDVNRSILESAKEIALDDWKHNSIPTINEVMLDCIREGPIDDIEKELWDLGYTLGQIDRVTEFFKYKSNGIN